MRLTLVQVLSVAAVTAAACVPPALPDSGGGRLPGEVAVRTNGRVESVDLEDYVLGSALAEVSPVDDATPVVERIFEIQAILARTYVVAHLGRHRAERFDVCDSTHCQVYDPARIRTSRFARAARGAVDRTAGVILTYSNRPAEALFHADCGGQTAAADAVWGGPAVPYLVAVSDEVPGVTHREWRLTAPVEQLRVALNADARSIVGRRLDAIEVLRRDASGRAMRLAVVGDARHELRGEDLRAIANRSLGVRAIQSTKFLLRQSTAGFTFEGAGFGHGVGLCQAGAAGRARRRDSVEAVFAHYYPGAGLVRR